MLKPDVASFLAGPAKQIRFPKEALSHPEPASEYLQRMRARPARDNSEVSPVHRVSETEIADGVRVRIYEPGDAGPYPVLVYFHGGGWVLGDLEMHDLTCRRLCRGAELTVMNVDYRLAPEHPFPAPLDDCYASVVWAAAHAQEYSGDAGTLAVGGSSAGGNLAAAVAVLARDRGTPAIGLQVLICPVIESDMDTESFRAYSDGFSLDGEQLEWYWRQYVPEVERRESPLVSLSRLESVAGLPPAIVITAEYDPLRDEAERYAGRLQTEGAGAALTRYAGQIHGFMGLAGVIDDADVALDALSDSLRARLHT
jgi:acetyl esterase